MQRLWGAIASMVVALVVMVAATPAQAATEGTVNFAKQAGMLK